MSKHKLGEFIELVDERNSNEQYSLKDVRGISIQKKFIDTKANMEDVSLRPYILVKPSYFAYVTVTSRNGEKITLALNTSNETYIVSSSYVVFKIKESKKNELLVDYLFMYFKRAEFDRYSRFNSWGSARETFSWESMQDIELEIPSYDIQKKYVDIYLAMVANQQAYEKGLDDLKLTCDAYIEDLRRKMPSEKIGEYITQRSLKNSDMSVNNLRGLTRDFGFQKPSAMSDGVDISKYNIVKYNDVVYPPPHFGEIGTIGIYKDKNDCVVSPMYYVFYVNNSKLLPDYMFLWFKRSEFMRYGFFVSAGSIRDTFELEELGNYQIPIPDIKVQQSIVNVFNVYEKRKQINEQLKNKIAEVCPILIRGSELEA
jgi:type I restriction enzyme S subunit